MESESYVMTSDTIDAYVENESESLDLNDAATDHALSGSSDTGSEFNDELQVSYNCLSNDDTHVGPGTLKILRFLNSKNQ